MEHCAGILIYNRSTDCILLGHPTCGTTWDLFKGHVEDDETARTAAHREVLEESGLAIPDTRLTDLGEFNYIPKKKALHVYLFITHDEDEALPDIKMCKCTSYFTKGGSFIPEMNAYKWIPCSRLKDFLTANLCSVVEKCLWSVSPSIGHP